MINRIADIHVAHRPHEINNADKSLEEAPSAYYHHFTGLDGDVLGTRKKGFSYGQTPYVGYVDPDDYLVGDPWFDMAAALDTGQYSIVYCNSLILGSDKTGETFFADHKWSKEWHFSYDNPIHAPVLIRRDILDKVWGEIYANKRLVRSMRYRANSIIYTHLIMHLPAYFMNRICYVWNTEGNNSHTLAKAADIMYQYDYKKALAKGLRP